MVPLSCYISNLGSKYTKGICDYICVFIPRATYLLTPLRFPKKSSHSPSQTTSKLSVTVLHNRSPLSKNVFQAIRRQCHLPEGGQVRLQHGLLPQNAHASSGEDMGSPRPEELVGGHPRRGLRILRAGRPRLREPRGIPEGAHWRHLRRHQELHQYVARQMGGQPRGYQHSLRGGWILRGRCALFRLLGLV